MKKSIRKKGGILLSVVWTVRGRSVGAFVPPNKENKGTSFFSRGIPPVCDRGWELGEASAAMDSLFGVFEEFEEEVRV